MGLQLPEYEQVLFEESPLEEVVCQLRFHPILKISSEQPVEFQEAVRKHFPVFAIEHGISFGVGGVGGNQPFMPTNDSAWQFKTDDDSWIVSLTHSFIALKTTSYQDIEDFIGRLFSVLPIFERIYAPPFYSRVGLRYVNRIVVRREENKRVQWERFLNPHLASVYADPALQDGVAEAGHHLVLISDTGKIGWRYSCDTGQADGEPAERYTLDFDHFDVGKIASDGVKEKLLAFNQATYRLFRWCLTEEGAAMLKPHPKNDRSAI